MTKSPELELTPRDIEILFALLFEPALEEPAAPIDLLPIAGNADLSCSATLR